MRLLVTGGAGFMGCNFVRQIVTKHPNWEVVVFDALTYAGRIDNLKDVWDRIKFIKGDVRKREQVERALNGCEAVVHFAAETHVDRSFGNPTKFVRTNVLGMLNVLEACRKCEPKKLVHISTDEVYGQALRGEFKEGDPLKPRNPYSASKACQDMLCHAYFETYELPIVMLRPTNNYGPYQHPEKLIPKTIVYALLGKAVPIHGSGEYVREWLYVRDCCEAIDLILERGKGGEVYNVPGECELKNLEVVKKIFELLEKPCLITFTQDRPCQDVRYALDGNKIKELGWEPKTRFIEGLKYTVDWYKRNEWWWKPIIEKQKIDFHEKF